MRILYLENEFKIEKHGLDSVRFCLLLHGSPYGFLVYVVFIFFLYGGL